MLQIGKYNTLRVVKQLGFGIYLDGGEHGEILMPKRYVPENIEIDADIEAFIYFDSEDRIIATTEKPFATVGEFACLEVVSVNSIGAFLDWGLSKDLLVPFRQQKIKMEVGRNYVVYLYLDQVSNRVAASAKLDYYLDNVPPDYTEGQQVHLMVVSATDLGYKTIVNSLHWGMLYKNEVFQPLRPGQELVGYIKKVRDDEKIDLCLQKPGYEKIKDISEEILSKIKEQNGFLKVSDKSTPDIIYNLFGVSKKVFKNAIGALYKKGLVALEPNGVRIVNEE